MSDDSRFTQVFEQENGENKEGEHDYFYLNKNGLYFCQEALRIMKKQRGKAKDRGDTQEEDQDEQIVKAINPTTRIDKSTLSNRGLLCGSALFVLSIAFCAAAFYLQKNYDQKRGESIALMTVAAVFFAVCAITLIFAAKENKESVDISQVNDSTYATL